MRLISLTLENIKSYQHETITFYDGVNFVSGANGAGKTTIIEAVGYALFNASPFSSMAQFVREGQKSGRITVLFEAADERIYRVVRQLRLPTGGSWAVYDEESDLELNELHGNQDIKAWLAANLNMSGGLEATLLFEDVIGISQGSFTAPFLQKPRERRNTFNKILQLDSYRDSFEKTSGLEALLLKSIAEKEGDKKGLLVRAEGFETYKSELAINRGRIDLIRGQVQQVQTEITRLDGQIEEQEKVKTLAETKTKELHNLEMSLTSLSVKRERAAKDLQEAERCREIIAVAEAGYRTYLQLGEKRQELETKRKEKDALSQKYRTLETAIASLGAQLESEAQNRAHRLESGEAELKDLQSEGEKVTAAGKEATQEKLAAEKEKAGLADLQRLWNRPELTLPFAGQSKSVLDALPESFRYRAAEKNELTALLGLEAEFLSIAGKLPALELESKKVAEELGRVDGRLAALEDNRGSALQGICPFFAAPCANIEGDLAEYFASEITALSKEAAALRLRESELAAVQLQEKKAIESIREEGAMIIEKANTVLARRLQEAAGRCAAAEDRLKSLRERYKKISDALSVIRQDAALQKQEAQLKEMQEESAKLAEKLLQYSGLEQEYEESSNLSARLEPDYKRYMQNVETAQKAPLLDKQLQQLQAEEELLTAQRKSKKADLEQLRAQYDEEMLGRVRAEREKLLAERAKMQAELNYAEQEAAKYEKLLAEIEIVFRQIKDLEAKIAKEEKAREMLRLVRMTLNQSGEKMAEVYRQYIGREAALIYQQISAENANLLWTDDYEIKLIDRADNKERERIFGQLSGGEKMTSALAIRLALLKQLSGLGIGFFDEPTANLDEKRRLNLARIIPEITRSFKQIFIISHDDSFDAITENVIALKKDANKGTLVVNEMLR